MSQKDDFNVNCIYEFVKDPNIKDFYKSMVNRGYKMNLQDRNQLKQCEEKIQRYNSRKDIFVLDNIDCHDFYFLLADKYNIDYISYRLILNSLDAQLLRNMYRYVWVQWQELADSLYDFIENVDNLEFCEDNNVEDSVEIIYLIIGHNFKYKPEQIDNIYNAKKLRTKILSSFNKFCRKRIHVNFVLLTIQKYFME